MVVPVIVGAFTMRGVPETVIQKSDRSSVRLLFYIGVGSIAWHAGLSHTDIPDRLFVKAIEKTDWYQSSLELEDVFSANAEVE